MKILLPIQPASGHYHPLAPLARQLLLRGHDVKFATSASFAPIVARNGFDVLSLGLDWLESEAGAAFPEMTAMSFEEIQQYIFDHVFASVTAERMAFDIVRHAEVWRPDLVVREPYEFGGYIAAQQLGIPHVTAGIGVFFPPEYLSTRVQQPLDALRRVVNLPEDPGLRQLLGRAYLHFLPPSIAPAPPLERVFVARPPVFDSSITGDAARLPGWWQDMPYDRTVLVTLGTVFNRADGLLDRLIRALADEPFNVVATCGRNVDPASFGALPASVRVEPYVPLPSVLPACDVLVSHAGYNTMVTGLTFGVPQVVVPLTADQPMNAGAMHTAGVADVLNHSTLDAQDVRTAVRHAMNDVTMRDRAASVRREIEGLPDHAAAAEWLTTLAAVGV
ncbi:glycosyltransferase [Deinococcus pimensis]|uniref:glycosyltransferase n=1 Tax=Deinococcus pimensis TaxID=309888 RepID=UPI00069329D3|nr:glycosyltransferase [Deinococcus pimensis]